jgi:hypothetical protein
MFAFSFFLADCGGKDAESQDKETKRAKRFINGQLSRKYWAPATTGKANREAFGLITTRTGRKNNLRSTRTIFLFDKKNHRSRTMKRIIWKTVVFLQPSPALT